MKPTEKQKKLFFEFCKYLDQDNNFEYKESPLLGKNVYIINVYYNFITSRYYFSYNNENNTIEVSKREDFNIFNIKNITNEWIRFLRKKKLEKLQK